MSEGPGNTVEDENRKKIMRQISENSCESDVSVLLSI